MTRSREERLEKRWFLSSDLNNSNKPATEIIREGIIQAKEKTYTKAASLICLRDRKNICPTRVEWRQGGRSGSWSGRWVPRPSLTFVGPGKPQNWKFLAPTRSSLFLFCPTPQKTLFICVDAPEHMLTSPFQIFNVWNPPGLGVCTVVAQSALKGQTRE